MIRYLIECGVVYHEDGRWKAGEEIEDIHVPDTIQSVLLSRVDRLESETRYILQCASVIGRLFRYRLLDHLAQHERDLESHLSELEGKELILEERTVPELEYAFKHALTQEATYQGILEQRRRTFHQQVAEGIEGLYQDRIEEFYEELAHHYRTAGNDEKAIDYLLKAGIKAASNFLNHDALRYFTQAEELLKKSTEPHHKEMMMLHEQRGSVLQLIGRWMEALREYEEALKWADDPHDRAGIYQKMGWLECEEIQDKVNAIRHWNIGLKELPENDKSLQKVQLEHSIIWAWGGGTIAEDLASYHHIAGMAEQMGYYRDLAIVYAKTELWQSFGGIYSDEYGQRSVTLAEESGDLATLAWVCHILGGSRLWGRPGLHWTEQSIPYFRRSLEICQEIGNVQLEAMNLGRLGQIYRKLGDDKESLSKYKRTLDIAIRTKSIMLLHLSSGIMPIHGDLGQADQALPVFNRIICCFDELEIDDESQARALLGGPGSGRIVDDVYQNFLNAYNSLSGSQDIYYPIRTALERLLVGIQSRPLRAWCCIELMNIHLTAGNMESAECYAQKTISILEEMDRPDYMAQMYSAYLAIGKTDIASNLAYGFLARDIRTINGRLNDVELEYHRFGRTDAFHQLCDRIQQDYKDELGCFGVNQLYLCQVDSPENFLQIEYCESFNWDDSQVIPEPWEWFDPEGTCSYSLSQNPARIEISAASESSLTLGSRSAPRIAQSISGDFALETRMGGEKLGGLFIIKDECDVILGCGSRILGNFDYRNEIVSLTNNRIYAGRGFMDSQFATLRLERNDNVFTAYCSDGQNWYSCGWINLDIEDPVRVGIFASNTGDASQAVTSFDYFRILRKRHHCEIG